MTSGASGPKPILNCLGRRETFYVWSFDVVNETSPYQRKSFVDRLEHSVNVSDEHARVTQDILLHEKYGVLDLTRRSEDSDDGILAVFVPEQNDRGSADVARG